MSITCDIVFGDDQSNVRYSGTLLRGKVILTLASSESCSGIYIEIDGAGSAGWLVLSEWRIKRFESSETYIRKRVYLAGGPSGKFIHFEPFFTTYSTISNRSYYHTSWHPSLLVQIQVTGRIADTTERRMWPNSVQSPRRYKHSAQAEQRIHLSVRNH